jgi:hypothetical protein
MVPTPFRTLLTAGVVVLLAGCARSQLASDLHSADNDCRAQHFTGKSALVACLQQHERPVWAKESPATLDIYDHFAGQRAKLAQQYDAGTLTEPQYRAQLDALEAESRSDVAARAQQTAAKPENADGGQ